MTDATQITRLSPVAESALDWGYANSQLVIRAARRLGALALRAPLPLVSLAEADLLAEARRETGLSDWGNDEFRPALRVLLGALENDARLSLIGRLSIRQDLVRLLAQRLCIQEDLRRRPEIAQTPIRRPIFVVGLPRTGTTLLHKLLSSDPDGRAPLLWELWYPSVWPRWDMSRGDPRIAKTNLVLKLMSVMSPKFSSIHHLAASEPDECFHVLQATFRCAMFTMRGDVHSYTSWLASQDMVPAYRYYRRVLQRLQWGKKEKHWVLKSPVHLFALDALLAAFPDACVIQTHRHPLHAAASCCSMTRATRVLHCDDVDSRKLGADWMETWGTALDRAMNARRVINPARIYDLSYDDLMADPQKAIRQIYKHFGYPLGARTVEGVERWLRVNPQNKHGEHRYTPEEFGLEPGQVRRRFADYCEQFGISLGGKRSQARPNGRGEAA